MTERLTSDWTKTTQEAFGHSKGMKEEEMVYNYLSSFFPHVTRHDNDPELQKAGIDITYFDEWGISVTVQVKGNYYIETSKFPNVPTTRTFIVERSISKVKADIMVHVAAEHGMCIMYPTHEMVKHIEFYEDDIDWFTANGKQCCRLHLHDFDWIIEHPLISE